MKLYEVMEELNTGKTIGELATNLGIRESDLERKLRNAAIVFDEDKKVWVYMGGSAEKSLSRNVNKKIRTLEADKPYVNYEKDQEPKETVVIEKDYEYKLYKDYLNVDPSFLMEKKTFFLSN
ncbi:hypothetical protein [Bacillus sp. FJAT-29790]|uniref:hypothetical protein n=1 Tax=Bacillus sp. FJAT-29790 TaxID=1895002 RepID=UPI0020B393BD|nr:hypothetical protein [Bacillus sp. FJAT-29790]